MRPPRNIRKGAFYLFVSLSDTPKQQPPSFLFTSHFVTCIHRKRVIFTYFTHLKRDIQNGR